MTMMDNPVDPPVPSEDEKHRAFEWLRSVVEARDVGESFLAYVALREWSELKRRNEADQRDAVLEEAAMIALKERCVRGTTWDLACTTIADAIRAAMRQSASEGSK